MAGGGGIPFGRGSGGGVTPDSGATTADPSRTEVLVVWVVAGLEGLITLPVWMMAAEEEAESPNKGVGMPSSTMSSRS